MRGLCPRPPTEANSESLRGVHHDIWTQDTSKQNNSGNGNAAPAVAGNLVGTDILTFAGMADATVLGTAQMLFN